MTFPFWFACYCGKYHLIFFSVGYLLWTSTMSLFLYITSMCVHLCDLCCCCCCFSASLSIVSFFSLYISTPFLVMILQRVCVCVAQQTTIFFLRLLQQNVCVLCVFPSMRSFFMLLYDTSCSSFYRSWWLLFSFWLCVYVWTRAIKRRRKKK